MKLAEEVAFRLSVPPCMYVHRYFTVRKFHMSICPRAGGSQAGATPIAHFCGPAEDCIVTSRELRAVFGQYLNGRFSLRRNPGHKLSELPDKISNRGGRAFPGPRMARFRPSITQAICNRENSPTASQIYPPGNSP